MSYPTCWDPARVRQVLTTESRQKDRALFLQTHRSFRRIRVDFCKDGGVTGPFIDEGQLRSVLHAGDLDADNRLFFIVGEAGSGKSELCQWLEYASDESRRLVVHIPRSMTSAVHVARLLRQRLSSDGPATGLRGAPPATQAQYIALSAVVLLYERGQATLAPADRWEPLLLSEPLRDDLVAYLDAAAHGRPAHRPLSASRLSELCQARGIAVSPEELSTSAKALSALLAQAMDQTIWMADIRSLLAELSDGAVAQGRRPLLLLEDITAFQMLGDLLLDYLLDLTSGHYDAIIGVTTGFERTQLAGATLAGDLTHIHHRLRARFVLTDDLGRSYGLDEEIIELTRGYLRAIRPGGCGACPSRSACGEAFGPGLYPFTETALRRALECLHEEGNARQTPRLFIEHVLGAVLLSDHLPPQTLDASGFLRRPPNLFRAADAGDERLESLLRWYGQVEDDSIEVDARIAEHWRIPAPDTLLCAGAIRAPRTYTPAPPGDATQPIGWEQSLRELQRWLAHGGLYPDRETLKRGIERALLSLGDPRSIASPDSLSLVLPEINYERGDERLPIFLADESGDLPAGEGFLKVHIARAPEDRPILEELAYLALSGVGLSDVCQNLALTLAWAEQRWTAYHQQVRALLAERLRGIIAEQLVLVSWRMLCSLSGASWADPPPLMLHEEGAARYAESTPWHATRHATCYVAGRALIPWHEPVRRLFIGAFTLRDTLVDRPRLHATLAETCLDTTLERLAHLPTRALRGLPYKIRPGGQRLYELLSPLQRYAQALCELDLEAELAADIVELARCDAHLRAQGNLDLAALRTQLAELRWRCGEVGVSWREAWGVALATAEELTAEELCGLEEQCRALRERAQTFASALNRSVWDYIELRHALRPMLAHPYWALASTLRSIQADLLRGARARYRSDGRVLTGTQGYRQLLATMRELREELSYE